jgi:hypothetical protein
VFNWLRGVTPAPITSTPRRLLQLSSLAHLMAFELNRMSIDDQAFDSFEQDFRQRQNVLNTRINELNIGLTREGSYTCFLNFCFLNSSHHLSFTDRRPDVIKTCENDVFDLGNMV